MSIKIFNSHASSDGAGVKIQRVHGFQHDHMSPFLMIDQIYSDNADDYGAGFPEHPHRGIETLTYIRHGGFEHQDHLGNKGQISSGGAQWMSAGRGILHSEMPLQKDGLMHGFQLWINLPAKDKMKPAEWKDYPAEQMQWDQIGSGAEVKVIAGGFDINENHYVGPIQQLPANASVADLQLSKQGSIQLQNLAENTLIFVYSGSLVLDGEVVDTLKLARITEQDHLDIEATEDSGFLLLAGTPLNEPVVHHGPFVMNSQQQINDTIRDYQLGRFTEL